MSTYRTIVWVELTANTLSNRVETDFISDFIWNACLFGAEIDSGTGTTLMPCSTSCIEFIDGLTATRDNSLGFFISDLTPTAIREHSVDFCEILAF